MNTNDPEYAARLRAEIEEHTPEIRAKMLGYYLQAAKIISDEFRRMAGEQVPDEARVEETTVSKDDLADMRRLGS